MSSGRLQSLASILFALCAASCNGGSESSGSSNALASIEQDLSLDPSGLTTVVTFLADPGVLTPANFDTNGTQAAQNVSQVGATATIVWDQRVTPAHQVRAMGLANVPSAFMAVTTSDSSVPSFVISSANQVAGLGADTISVQFSGPRVVESEAEDLNNWTLKIGTTTLPLAGTTLSLDNNTQVLSITTGTLANLHASFTLAAKSTLHSVADVSLATTAVVGAATGDLIPPTLSSVEQNLSVDEYGRVIDLSFSEAMDPIFCAALSNFGGSIPDVCNSFSQPAENVLRVTFNNPIVPGLNTIDLENLVDAHGNAFPDQNVAVSAGSTVANGFSTGPDLTTVEGVGGDLLEMEFVQALDPDDASDPTKWNLEVPTGNVIDLSGCVFTYDLLAKTLSIELDVDFQNGTSFTFEGLSGDEPIDVDGELFTSSVAGSIGGEVNLPTVVSATQNRVIDPTGKTLDVVFSEGLDESSAENLANWSVAGHVTQTATLLASQAVVRLEFDSLVLPGTDAIDINGITDLAGNPMVAVLGLAVGSTDSSAPAATAATAQAVEGSANDWVRINFNDDLLVAEISDLANWSVQSPIGTPLNLAGASVSWNAAGRQASVTLPNGIDLAGGASLRASFSGVHDIAGNTISAAAVTTTVAAEVNVPQVDSVWVESVLSNHVHVRFSEPCTYLDDIAGLTHYAVRNSGGVLKGNPSSATVDADDLGVELVYGFAVLAGSDTLDIEGVTDLAGNAMFPVSAHAVAVEDGGAVDIDAGASSLVAISGESNDVVTIVFTQQPARWEILNPANYTLSLGGFPLDLSGAHWSFDGALSVSIELDAAGLPNLQSGAAYDVDVAAMNSVQGVQGSPMNALLVCGGDVAAPSLPAGLTRIDAANPLDSVLLQFSEAVDEASSENVANYDLNGGPNPDSVVRVGFNTVRATWNGGVIVGDTLNATVADLAGNVGVLSRAVTAQDPQGPLVVSANGLSVENAGLDTVSVVFDKPVDTQSGLDPNNYVVTNGTALLLTNAQLSWSSTNNTVTIHLPAGVELDPTLGLNLQAQDVEDLAGLAMSPPANVGGSVTGDGTPPGFAAAFANYRADAAGLAIDVRFTEDVAASFVGTLGNWSVSGGQSVDAVLVLSPAHLRLSLSAPLASGETLGLNLLPDMAGNESGAIAIAPAL